MIRIRKYVDEWKAFDLPPSTENYVICFSAQLKILQLLFQFMVNALFFDFVFVIQSFQVAEFMSFEISAGRMNFEMNAQLCSGSTMFICFE